MLRFPPRRILVAVEFSKASMFAWDAAKEVAARFGSVLEAVWCAEPVVTELTGLQNLSRRPGFRADALNKLRARLGPGARLHAVNGEPSRAIRRLALDRGCDLLVLGTHRRPGLVRWLQGSVAEAVVHSAPCPVLVVPRPWKAPRWVLAPVTGAAYARRGFQAAAILARAYRGRLAALEVVSDPELGPLAEKRLAAHCAKLPGDILRATRPELEVRNGAPIDEILRAERGRDLIVLVAHRKSLLGDMVLGTTVERVLRHSRVPVLAIPSP